MIAAPQNAIKVSDQDISISQNAENKGKYEIFLIKKDAFLKRLSPYLIALRPWSFTASFSPVALGSCLVYKSYGFFNPWIFVLTSLCALSVHAAGNLVNTYYDYAKGVDNKKSDDRTLVDHLLSPNDVSTMGAISYVVGCLGFLCLSYISPSAMEHIALLYFGGLSSSFLYTGGLGLKYIALGDIVIFLTFGPVTVLFAFISQGGPLSLTPLFYAVPLALNTEAILHCNNSRNMASDLEAGIVTLAILIGKNGSYALFVFLLFAPYLAFVVLATNFTKWFLLPLLTVSTAFSLERQFRGKDYETLARQMAKLNLKLAACYVLACSLAEKAYLPGFAD